MIRSRPLEVAGQFVAVAVQSAPDWHVVAIDPRLGDLHGARFASPEEAARVVRITLARETSPPCPRPGS